MEVLMKKLILATVSAVALGLAGAGPLYAADNGAANNPAPTAPYAGQTPTTGTMQSTAPSAGDTMQTPGSMGGSNQSPTSTDQSSMNGNNQSNNPAQASNWQSGGNWGRMTRSDLQQIQQKLTQEGLYHGRIDGLEGPRTQQALRVYQHRNGLPVTGTPDQQTLASLNGGGAGMGSSTPPASSNETNMNPSTNAGTNGANNPAPTTHP
jgi:peptidoglycan hydrolase-like protein with peptidoglycan-binding domain